MIFLWKQELQGSIFAVVQLSMTIEDHRDDKNNMDTCPLDEFSLTLPEKKKCKIFLWVSHILTTCYPFATCRNRQIFAAFFHTKIAILVCHIGWQDEWNHCQFTFHFFFCWCSVPHLYPQKTSGTITLVVLAILIRIWHLVMLTIQKNKLNKSKKRVSIPFSLHGSQRGLGFHLSLVFLCLPKAATTDMTC